MTVKSIFNLVIIFLFLAAVGLLFSSCLSMQKKPLASSSKEQPNIVFILADDLGYGDVGCYGQQWIKTPNIDQLAKDGMRFTDFYAGSTVCAPSRATLMTGQHTGHTYVRGNGEVPLPANDSILPQVLKQKGYTTGMVGKWGLGEKGTSGAPEKKGWDFFAGHLHHVEGHFQKPDSAWQIVNDESRKVKIPDGVYANEWFTKSGLDFINQNKNKPFFLYLAYTLPHAELIVPQKYLQQYLNADGSSKFSPETAQPGGLHYGAQPYPKAAYAAMVSQLDDYVGQINSLLEKLKLDENTIVIFTSDNGTHIEGGREITDATAFFQSSGPLRGIKRDLYEGGIRVPFIVKWKGSIAKNTTSSFIGAFWDLLPTLAEITNATAPNGDGMSFVNVLNSKQQATRSSALYWEFGEGGFKQAVRKDKWKAIRFYKDTKPVRTELYDLSNDIGERNNVAAQFPVIVRQMEQLMNNEHKSSAHPMFQIK